MIREIYTGYYGKEGFSMKFVKPNITTVFGVMSTLLQIGATWLSGKVETDKMKQMEMDIEKRILEKLAQQMKES